MKVLHVYKRAWPESFGGVESFIDSLCRNTSQLEIENTVLAHSTCKAPSWQKLNGYSLRLVPETIFFASTSFSFQAIREFKNLANNADVIHYHFPNPFADLLLLICGASSKKVVTYHADIGRYPILQLLYAPLMHWFLGKVDKIIATSPQYADTSPILAKYKDKTSVIPLGIDLSLSERCSTVNLKNFKPSLPSNFFLFIGALRHYKGLSDLLTATNSVGANLVIAGDGEQRESMKGRIKRDNMNNIYMVGKISDDQKHALLSQCTAVVLPSPNRSEAFGFVLLEGAAFKKPLVCCEVGSGTTYVNKHGETGLVVQPESPHELADAMEFILENPKRAGKFGMMARQRVVDLFCIQRVSSQYAELYRSLCA